VPRRLRHPGGLHRRAPLPPRPGHRPPAGGAAPAADRPCSHFLPAARASEPGPARTTLGGTGPGGAGAVGLCENAECGTRNAERRQATEDTEVTEAGRQEGIRAPAGAGESKSPCYRREPVPSSSGQFAKYHDRKDSIGLGQCNAVGTQSGEHGRDVDGQVRRLCLLLGTVQAEDVLSCG